MVWPKFSFQGYNLLVYAEEVVVLITICTTCIMTMAFTLF